MNNLAQKNVIYNLLSVNSELPYQTTNQVSLKANQIIYAAINHTFDKMVDNDLYNEKAILNDGNYTNGPKLSSITINTDPNHTKIFPANLSNSSNELSILQKNEHSLTETLLGTNIIATVNFIEKTVDGYLVGTDDGLYHKDNALNLDIWENVKLVDLLPDEKSIGKAVYKDTTRDQLYFSTDRAIRVTRQEIENSKMSTTLCVQVSAEAIDRLPDERLVIGNSNGLSSQTKNNDWLIHNEIENLAVNDLKHLNQQIVLAATDSGIYKSKSEHSFDVLAVQNPENVDCKFVYRYTTKTGTTFVLVATSAGLYKFDEMSISQIDADSFAEDVTGICAFSGQIYIAATSTTGYGGVYIYDYDKNTICRDLLFGNRNVIAIYNYKNTYLVAITDSGIIYTTPNRQKLYNVTSKTYNAACQNSKSIFVALASDRTISQIETVNTQYFELIKDQEFPTEKVLWMDADYVAMENSLYDLAGNRVIDDKILGKVTLNTIETGAVNIFFGNSVYYNAEYVYPRLNAVNDLVEFDNRIYIAKGNCIYFISKDKFLARLDITFEDDFSCYELENSAVEIKRLIAHDGKLICQAGSALLIFVPTTAVYLDNDQIDAQITALAVSNTRSTLQYELLAGKNHISAYQCSTSSLIEIPIETSSNDQLIMSYGIGLDVNSNDRDIKKYGTNEICPFSYLFTSSPTLSNLYDVRYVDFVPLSDSSNYSILETSVSKTLINKSNLIYADIDATRVSSIEPSGSQLSGVHNGTYERDDSASSFTSTCLSSIEFLSSLTIDEHIYVLCSETAPYLSTNYQTSSYIIESKTIDKDQYIAKYCLIADGTKLSAVAEAPTYKTVQKSCYDFISSFKSLYLLPFNQTFAISKIVKPRRSIYANMIDMMFTAATSSSAGYYRLRQDDYSIGEKLKLIGNVTTSGQEVVNDVFSYQLRLTDTSCKYSIFVHTDTGYANFDYITIASADDIGLSTSDISFVNEPAKHFTRCGNENRDIVGLSLSGSLFYYNGSSKVFPTNTLSKLKLTAFELVDKYGYITDSNGLSIISDFYSNLTTTSFDPSAIVSSLTDEYRGLTAAKKYYQLDITSEPTSFAVFYALGNNGKFCVFSDSGTIELPVKTYDNINTVVLQENRHLFEPQIIIESIVDGKSVFEVYTKSANSKESWSYKALDVRNISENDLRHDLLFVTTSNQTVIGDALFYVDQLDKVVKYSEYELQLKECCDVRTSINDLAVYQHYQNSDSVVLVEVFAATDSGLKLGILSADSESQIDINTLVLSSLSAIDQFDPQASSLSSVLLNGKITTCDVVNCTLYFAAKNDFGSSIVYSVYACDLTAQLTSNIAYKHLYDVHGSEAAEFRKIRKFNNQFAVVGKVHDTDHSQIYNIRAKDTIVNEEHEELAEKTSYIEQLDDKIFVSDSSTNTLNVLNYDKDTGEYSYGLCASVYAKNLTYLNDKYYIVGNHGLSILNSDMHLSAIPELSNIELETVYGIEKYGLNNGVYVQELYSNIDVVNSKTCKKTTTFDEFTAIENTIYCLNDNDRIEKIGPIDDISQSIETELSINNQTVKHIFDGLRFAVLNDDTLYDSAVKSVLERPIPEINYIESELMFGKNSSQNVIEYIRSIDQNLRFRKIIDSGKCNRLLRVDSTAFLVASEDGLFVLDLSNVDAKGNYVLLSTDLQNVPTDILHIDDFSADRYSGMQISSYIASTQTDLVKSEIYKTGFNNHLLLTAPDVITAVKQNNRYEYLIGTNSGLYYTSYQYDFKNDLIQVPFSQIDLEIQKTYQNTLQEHIERYHQPSSSVAYVNSNVMPVDFSDIDSSWQKINYGMSETSKSNFKIIRNDIVETVDFGNAIQHIKVEYSNVLTQVNGEDSYNEIDGTTYICKRWKSGLIELYLSIPTTYTYYFPHVKGNSYCCYDSDNIVRKNFSSIEVEGDLDNAATTFRITIYKKYFQGINNIVSMNLNGQSLPLKIYKDDTYTGEAQNYFHSFIEPSLIISQTLYIDKIVIICKCFGTDAQALYILADSSDVALDKVNFMLS